MLRDRGTTVFLTTHYLEEADALCDRLVIIDHGEIVADGAPQELKREVSGDLVEIAIAGDGGGVEAALALLEPQPFVREAIVEGPLLRLYVEDATAATPALLRLLDERGIGLRTLRLAQPTLDDVFLRQTGRSLRDAGGPAATPPTPTTQTGESQ
jgi:ABC-2 type transport system ATP-binding protein